MAKFGLSYMGSKDSIAFDIIKFLPRKKRLYDLFGGGGAIFHCAALSEKYNEVIYNELNPLLPKLIKDAIAGKYNYDVFSPEWITREMFFDKKEQDGYIKYNWSFGNNGNSYIFGKDKEEIKRVCHQAVVFDVIEKGFLELFPKFTGFHGCNSITEKRLYLKMLIKEQKLQRIDLEQLEQLEQLERLQQLQQLERLKRLKRLIILNKSYDEVEILPDSVVYCDPPYENTAKYCDDGFDHKKFYNWVATRDFPVYFSSYEISDNRFEIVWSKNKRSMLSPNKNKCIDKIEYIYWNGIK